MEDQVNQVSRQLVDRSLSDTRVEKVKLGDQDPQQLYALFCLDPSTFLEALEKMEEPNQTHRAALKERAKSDFSDLDFQLKIPSSQ